MNTLNNSTRISSKSTSVKSSTSGLLIPAPVDISEIDAAMQKMDKFNGTSFYAWIRDDSHLDQITFHCKRILNDYQVENIALGLCWLTQDWTASRTAELLIKMFYHWGMASEKFASIVNSMLKIHNASSESTEKGNDILLTLLIGEDAKVTSKFMFNMTKGMEASKITEMTNLLARRMDWSAAFYQDFVINFTQILYQDIGDESYVISTVKLVKAKLASFDADFANALGRLALDPIHLSVEQMAFYSIIFEVTLSNFGESRVRISAASSKNAANRESKIIVKENKLRRESNILKSPGKPTLSPMSSNSTNFSNSESSM